MFVPLLSHVDTLRKSFSAFPYDLFVWLLRTCDLLGGGGTLISALRRERQVDLCEFKASLVYKMSSRTARTQKNPISKINK